MSSSPISSSSSEPVTLASFAALYDVRCPVHVMLGTGTLTVRACLALAPSSVIPLQQSAGEDLGLFVNAVQLARGEVVIVDDTVALRVTEISPPPAPKALP
jgi:flagellar motor switch protein FliN